MTLETIIGLTTLVGFIITIVKTFVPLIKAITRLTDKLESLEGKVDEINTSKNEEHKELWAYNDKQDEILQDHAMRLHDLDGKG